MVQNAIRLLVPLKDLPSVAVACRKAHEAVGQVVLVDNTAELAALVRGVAQGLVVVANDSLSDQSSEVVIVVPADTLDSNGDVGGGNSVVAYPDIRANELGLPLGEQVGVGFGGVGGELGEVLVGHLDELLVGNATSTNQDHAVGSVVVLDVVGQLGPGDVADVLLGAQDSAAEGLPLEGSGVQVVEHDLLDLLLDFLGLAQDNVTLPLNGGGLELGVLENIGENVDAFWHVLVQALGEVYGVLTLKELLSDLNSVELCGIVECDVSTYRGVGVQVGAHVLDLEL